MLSAVHEVLTFNFHSGKKRLIPFRFIYQLVFILLFGWKSKVFICHFAGYGSFLPALLGKIFRKPCLIIVAGNDAACFPDMGYGNYTRWLLGFFTRKSLALAARILPVHERLVYQDYHYYAGGMPAQGYAYFAPEAKGVPYTPVHYGYDAEVFRIKDGVQRQPNSFLTIGNLADRYIFKRKGYDLILELARRRPDLSFTMVGSQQIKGIVLPPNVKLLPFMPIDKVVDVMNEHEYYFQLSIMEGFPNALAEAMLCGCIPIGSSVSGIPFIVGDTGYILETREVHLLSALIDEALGDPGRKKLSSLARNRVKSKFSPEHRMAALEAVIQLHTKRNGKHLPADNGVTIHVATEA